MLNSGSFNSPADNKATENDCPNSKEEEKKIDEVSATAETIPDKEPSGAVDFDLALDYEEMDPTPHSDNEVEKEDAATKSIQHSQPKTKDNDNAESSDDSSGQGIYSSR